LDHNKTIIISAESGLLSIKDVEIDVIEIETYNDLCKALKWIKTNENNYENIFIDSLTEIGQIIFNELQPKYDKSKTFQLYKDYETSLIAVLKALRGTSEYNIWLTALDKSIENGINIEVSIDLIQKSLAKRIPALFDEVLYMNTVEHEGELKRIIATDNSVVDFAKDRSGKLSKYELPDLNNITKKIFNT
ncbi:MAG: AAA family ATPase, partial [Legionellales bacterium]|nr:AAA family ATPase [Legionellales bacterium]